MAEYQKPGFISVEQALTLIKNYTKEKPNVDLGFLVDNIDWIQTAHNFNIPLVEEKEVKGKKLRVRGESVFVEIGTGTQGELDKAQMRMAIKNKYDEITGKNLDIDSIGLRAMTTAVDTQKNGNAAVMPNPDSDIKLGDTLRTGTQIINTQQ